MAQYSDDDIVYVDPDSRTVVGPVEWQKDGNPKPLEKKDDKEKEGGKRRKRYYPWGSYRAMKKQFRIDGKEKEGEHNKTFDEALKLAQNEPFWD